MLSNGAAVTRRPDIDLQRAWDNAPLKDVWRAGRDQDFAMRAMALVPVEVTALGASGRVLEVAAGEAEHASRLNLRGLACVVLEPSAAMLVRAREHMEALGARLTFVRGIAQTLPFRDASFDRVLCESAIDHFQHPDAAVREIARVLAPGGRFVVSFVNYASLSSRVSRLAYRVWRRGAPVDPGHHLFWDSPVPIEHTFEATVPVIRTLCEPYLVLDRVVGASVGWGMPGWSQILARLPVTAAERTLRMLDRLARGFPMLADYVLTVWRHRPAGSPRMHGGQPIEELRVRPTDPAYQWRARAEADRSPLVVHVGRDPENEATGRRLANRALTGNADRSWLDELMSRGPFERAALLGSDEGAHMTAWIRGGASAHLDVYDPSTAALATLRRAADDTTPGASCPTAIRFVRADLNFVELPAQSYDVVWATGTLSRVVNLEYLLAQIECALRPGGLLAFHDYVGERRMQYDPDRLARVNAVLGTVPARFRIGDGPITPAPLSFLTPLCAVPLGRAARPDGGPLRARPHADDGRALPAPPRSRSHRDGPRGSRPARALGSGRAGSRARGEQPALRSLRRVSQTGMTWARSLARHRRGA